MIKTATKKGSVKEILQRERKEKEQALHAKCVALSNERFTEEKMKAWSVANQGLWFLPVLDGETGENIEALAIMKPITRSILSYASTKIAEEGLYEFLEAAMRECFIAGDESILDDDVYFIPAANSFNKIIEGKKAALIKR